MTRYVALLRAIAHRPMAPFREAMQGLGYAEIVSIGMSGNLIFGAESDDVAALERRISATFATDAMVRSAREIGSIVAADPLGDRRGASMMFLARAPAPEKRKAFLALDFTSDAPILRGTEVYFTYPLTVAGKRTHLDLERLLGVRGTARSMGIVRQIAAKMEPVAGKERKG